jgi:anaerobic selenocysteine-containing dehydrogenase
VHLSEKAVDPPGQARPDLDIFLDYARRMDFRNRDGEPLIPWSTPPEAFEAWQQCSAGRPCDYTPINYERLRSGGVQWGGERLYTDGVFNTDPGYCETYGQDLSTGAEFTAEQYRAKQPGGRAFLHAADYRPSPEVPSDEFPLLLTTGRTVYQFHTRTKTGRAPELDAAAPDVWIELHPDDAARYGITDGDLVGVASPRGGIEARARIGGIRPGVVFVPFHYGYFDVDPAKRRPRAANEMTVTAWDPVSKQPIFKVAAVRIARLAGPEE